MEQRLPGISDEQATGLVKQIFDGSNQLLGRTANLVRIFAHSPYLARWFLGFVVALRQPNAGAASDVRLRNLATLRTELESEEYNRRQHAAVGVTTRDLEDYASRFRRAYHAAASGTRED